MREGKTVWDGISSNAALKHMRDMRKGDLALIYHSGAAKAVIGLATINSDPYPDPKEKDPKLVVIEVAPKQRLPRAVPLAEIKKQKGLADFALVRISRLSVMPVTQEQWDILMELSGG